MVRIKDVAREAGVAASTVSLVMNKKGYVSEATRAKVEAAMKKLNYVPSEVARNLSLNRTNTIGVILPSISHPFFGEVVEALEAALYEQNYKMMLCCTQHKENAERTFVEMLKRRTMDGIIMGAHSLDVSLYDNIKQPIVAFDRFLNEDIPIVHCDHQQGGRMAAEALLNQGCRHVVEIVGYQGVSTPANEYHFMAADILQTHGATVHMLEMPWNAFTYSDFMDAARELFQKYPEADGIWGADLAISACLNVAVSVGRKVPEDLKLVAYDGTAVTRMGPQPITAVRQPIEGLCRLAVQKIIHMVNEEQDDSPWVLPPAMLKGETC
ncbi:putative sucrose operon transcriptional regulator (plasmid) [Selenomonas ruminantium subsp. lactilytica TAM6421]|uniref:Putative sucrose operon transcriptional regulator n=1 Tax=Selenomonas ruminantium subsp. lactilytica (strain NBRC 103574 / TAM6421) TaxID=927704 RepID=I0GW39_SELRL|nr:LacI family DNA-binding transcriptional regulator [Selenomonas ruminantium]BAL84976.1 putative sucrose operon transcriptional regulator [Selenomonas ruminantium subsp. lactilytica TAM6421]